MKLQPLTDRICRWFSSGEILSSFRGRHRYWAIALTVALFCGYGPMLLTVQAAEPGLSSSALTAQVRTAQALVAQSRQLYESGQLNQAESTLRDAIQQYQSQDNRLGEAMAQSNLALVLGQQGQWSEANGLIEQSLDLLQTQPVDSQQQSVLAQVLNVQGKLQLAQGRSNDALTSWKKAEMAYAQAGNQAGKVRSQLRQARALQAMGFYQRALNEILQPLEADLKHQPDSFTKVVSLRELGEALQVVDSLEKSRQSLERAEEIALELFEQAKKSDRPSALMAARQNLDATQLSFANTLYAQALEKRRLGRRYKKSAAKAENSANSLYQSIIERATSSYLAPGLEGNKLTAMQAQLNQLSLRLDVAKLDLDDQSAQLEQAETIWLAIEPNLEGLPPNRDGITARINLASRLMDLNTMASEMASEPSVNPKKMVEPAVIEKILAVAYEQAKAIDDLRSQSYVMGQLGDFYQAQRYYDRALEFTGQASLLAKAVNAPDISYRWYAQEGKLLKTLRDWYEQEGQLTDAKAARKGAISAYSQAVASLKSLRNDLAKINPEVMFSFQESIDPIHRELVSLLLETVPVQDQGLKIANRTKAAMDKTTSSPDEETLIEVQNVMESLRLEELHEYLQAACLETIDIKKVGLKQIADQANTAVLYTIILPEQLAIIVRLPGQEPTLYLTKVDQTTLEAEVATLRKGLLNRISFGFKQPAKQVYQWLFPPELERALANSETQSLVFVLDGGLRNIPMAALYDGEQYLLEKYSLAVTPSLELTDPQPLKDRNLATVAFGLTEGRFEQNGKLEQVVLPDGSQETFDKLPAVKDEVNDIQAIIPQTKALMNDHFTKSRFVETLQSSSAPIIHLATHGKFSSDRKSTFLLSTPEKDPNTGLMGNGLIDINTLARALEVRDGKRRPSVEMLVLSACETAVGDDRAALGIAGVALRSGTRSTVASLWSVDDAATSVLMKNFYQNLSSRDTTKAEALRQAQLTVLKDKRFRRHPYAWAPFILMGNWL